ncbi:DUF934 domain-containing protein [Thioclava sp. A2]|uniref:DUF934 domain-containing protein n=1 Tax=Thioclava sp. FCG-A2 TaxID=3080562 RepID=UPI002954E200|nr:DUF934 domain-containing protein [Thioclava sp. A2]MDV7271233.1 DUF934 domain-containing protein [Thioclava sp. A2]
MSLIISETLGVEGLAPDTPLDALDQIARDNAGADLRIRFNSFGDGRGFTLASALRRAGFAGRLIATGDLIPDQYPMALRLGFDAVEIAADNARRRDWEAWIERSPHATSKDSYQSRLRARASA